MHGLVSLSLWSFASDAVTLGVAQKDKSFSVDLVQMPESKKIKQKSVAKPTLHRIQNEARVEKSPEASKVVANDRVESSVKYGGSDEVIFEISGPQSPHPYFTEIWRKLSRESREFQMDMIQNSLQLFVSLSLEKNGLISNVRLKVENGEISDRQLKTISSRLQALRRLDPVPDEIANRGIQVIYRLKMSQN